MTAALFETPAVRPHPARFPPAVLAALARILDRYGVPAGARVLDPFAGRGGVHRLRRWHTFGVELEPEWARAHPRTLVGDATALPFAARTVAAVATSPAYGNRMADAYDGRDGSTRHTYRIDLGRPLSSRSGAAMQWGDDYRALHTAAVAEFARVLEPGGLALVNMKDHDRAGARQHVVDWWAATLDAHRLAVVELVPVALDGIRHGANAGARADAEAVIVARKSGR